MGRFLQIPKALTPANGSRSHPLLRAHLTRSKASSVAAKDDDGGGAALSAGNAGIEAGCLGDLVRNRVLWMLRPGKRLSSPTQMAFLAKAMPTRVFTESFANVAAIDYGMADELNMKRSSSMGELLEDEAVEGESETSAEKDRLSIAALGLPAELVNALTKKGITALFPIQRAVLEPVMKGVDVIARAKTGTGKTLAFGIPIIHRIITENQQNRQTKSTGRYPRALVLAPTRELAKQVEREFMESAPSLSTICVYGGVSIAAQQEQLERGVDVAVGTPGRIIDLINRGSLVLKEVKFMVLDEADQMLAVGFEEDVEKILQELPTKRQSMLFSATMPAWVKQLAKKYLKNPLVIDLVGEKDEKLADGIKLFALSATSFGKLSILSDLLAVYGKGGKSIVFTQRKRDADDVASAMSRTMDCEALHGDISQYQREKTLAAFRDGKVSILVATDVAARGLDVPNVDLVIHYEIPNDPETFVHRSGRTGRAGKEGTAILIYAAHQTRNMKLIEQEVGCKFELIGPPTSEDILRSTTQNAVNSIKKVHPDSRSAFLPIARKLLESDGVEALAAAMACICGHDQAPPSTSPHEKLPRLDQEAEGRRNIFTKDGGFGSFGRFSMKSGRGAETFDRGGNAGRFKSAGDNRSMKPSYGSRDSRFGDSDKFGRPSFGYKDESRGFAGTCYKCGKPGHDAAHCPTAGSRKWGH